MSAAPRLDEPIARLAAMQHGVVARRQLREVGLRRSGLDSRVRRGALIPIHPGVYAVGHLPLTVRSRWMAAVLAGGEGAVLSHRSAAQLWGIARWGAAPPEISRPRSFRRRAGFLSHQARLRPDEVEEVERIPVTSAFRTVLDLAARLDMRGLERLLNEVEARRLTDRVSMPELLDRHPRRPGSRLLRAVLGDAEISRGVTRSELEERFLDLVAAYGLPRPRLNASVAVEERFLEVDCLWAESRLIVELDGRAFHANRRSFEDDRARDRLLLTAGWRVVRLTWSQLRDEPARIAAQLRGLLETARPPTL